MTVVIGDRRVGELLYPLLSIIYKTMEGRTFSLKQLQEQIDSCNKFLETSKPVIGISTNHNHVDENTLTHTYCDSVKLAGGIPLIIPQTDDIDLLLETLGRCDGLIMSGGGDVHSLWWGEEPHHKVGKVVHNKDFFDLSLIQSALKLNIPVLGICRGLQLLNVALGGTLHQDIQSFVDGAFNHVQTATRYEEWHPVEILSDGRLRSLIGEDRLMVNSFHHQSVNRLADCGTICAKADDGVVEAVDFYPEYNALGVQWHPEALACEGKTKHLEIFKWLVDEAKLFKQARHIHQHIITIDSHVDTPSLLVGNPCGDSDIAKVDYSGMVTGGLDIAFMAAFVAQGSETPYNQMIDMLDATDAYAKESENKIVVLTDTSKAWEYKIKHQKMICKAVENGYAIGDDLSKLEELTSRGVKYITLCHNGDNQICDSGVRSHQTHGGLSDFGKNVVKEMNRLGIAIDVSHAADATVQDVLEISSAPVIASHSSCRAIYDHPRNLSDELMKAIADKGGVVQLCMYHGFLKDKGATVLDFVNHLMHAIDVVGIDYVGIGTDFDGGGEVVGCRKTADLHRITVELLRRGIAINQLSGLWGANLLRVIR